MDLRSGDDDFGVNEFLVEFGVLALLVGSGDESVALLFKPFPDAEFVLGRAQELWLLLGVDATLLPDIVLAPTLMEQTSGGRGLGEPLRCPRLKEST